MVGDGVGHSVDGGVDSVGDHGGGVHGVGNGGVDSVGNNGGVVGGGGVGNHGGSVVVGLSLVGDIGHVAVVVVGVVGDVLDPAVGKVDGVGALHNTGAVVVLSLLEGSAGVVVSDSVGVGVGGHLGEVVSDVSGLHGGVVGRGGVGNHGGGVHGVVDGGVDSVGNHGGVDSVVGEGGGVHGVVTQHGAELGGGGHRGQEGRHADSQHLGKGGTWVQLYFK